LHGSCSAPHAAVCRALRHIHLRCRLFSFFLSSSAFAWPPIEGPKCATTGLRRPSSDGAARRKLGSLSRSTGFFQSDGGGCRVGTERSRLRSGSTTGARTLVAREPSPNHTSDERHLARERSDDVFQAPHLHRARGVPEGIFDFPSFQADRREPTIIGRWRCVALDV